MFLWNGRRAVATGIGSLRLQSTKEPGHFQKMRRLAALASTALRHAARPGLARAAPSLPCGVTRRHLCVTRHDAHATLGLASDASTEQVKHAYYKLAMVYHPDRNTEPDAAERFAAIGAAYSTIMGLPERAAAREKETRDGPRSAAFAAAFPPWVYRAAEYLHRVPQRFDTWLAPSYSSLIYQHLRKEELAEALSLFEEMRLEGERPSHAVYEMLIRGCTIAMRRPAIGEVPDHLTINLVQKVLELWGDMQVRHRGSLT